jgi:hypothetical protein
MLGQSWGGDSKLFCLEVSQFADVAFTFISALEVTTAQVFYFRAVVAVTSSAEMKAKTAPIKRPTKLLDKTFWNPHPEIGLTSQAVSDEPSFFRLFLGHQN